MTIIAKLAMTTLAAPVLAALAIGLAGHAAAETPDSDGGTASAAEAIGQLRGEGMHVVVDKSGNMPLAKCSVIGTHQDRHEHHGGAQRDTFETAYVHVFCHA